MSDTPTDASAEEVDDPVPGDDRIDDSATQGTYELLRDRLLGHAAELRRRADRLNADRLEAFGRSTFEVAGSERIRTDNNCVSRDIVSIGGHLLFGYNVFIGLRAETAIDDVFSLHSFDRTDGYTLSPLPQGADWLHDAAFERDFAELYTYYKNARLLQLRRTEGRLLAVFQTGDAITDIRVFRWEVGADGDVRYLDNRGERDHVFPPQFDFEWQPVGRDRHVGGRTPHVSILDRVFVDPLDGTLELRVENNTVDGEVLLSEPVDEADQALADCEIWFAELGDLILLRIQPYREAEPRFYVVNTFVGAARREDAVGRTSQQLPDDHGVIHPGGIELRTGETKSFDLPIDDMEFKTAVRSPNGEDVLYVFHERTEGRSILLSYNLIRREVATPIQCHGYGLFDDGTMVVFREQDEPTRVHPMQIWRTPFVTDEYHAQQPIGDGMLERIGNAELVRGVSEAVAIERLAADTEPSVAVFEDLARAAAATLDAHYWLSETDVGDLATPLDEIRRTAELIIDEFEKVQALEATAASVVAQAEERVAQLVDELRSREPGSTEEFVDLLGRLRREQGELITHRSIRYVDRERIDQLEQQVIDDFDALSGRAVGFLSADAAFAGFHSSIDALVDRVGGAPTVAELEPITDEMDEIGAGLDLLTDVVGSLDIADTTVRTAILERVSATLGALNRARAIGENRHTELRQAESTAAFGVEFALFSQNVAGEISRATTPEACDAALGSLMVQLESLETTFAAFDDYLEQIATKREDVYESLASRKQQLLDERQRTASRLGDAAERILDSVRRRIDGFTEAAEINAFFASDPMVAKVRSIAGDLRAIDQPVQADELTTRLDAARDEAARSLRDRSDIFEDDGNVIRFGRHRFSVDTQPLELTTAFGDGEMHVVLTGTDFRQPVDDRGFADTAAYWDQVLVSETPAMYRSTYLATSLLATEREAVAAAGSGDALLAFVQQRAEARFDEGYDRGVHDHDAARILDTVVARLDEVGRLQVGPAARALAVLFWTHGTDEDDRSEWALRSRTLGALRAAYPDADAVVTHVGALASAIDDFVAVEGLTPGADGHRAAAYLFEELTAETPAFVVSERGRELHDAMWRRLDDLLSRTGFEAALAETAALADRLEIVTAWLTAFATDSLPDDLPHVAEAAAMVVCPDAPRTPAGGHLTFEVDGLLGQHPTIEGGVLRGRIDDLLDQGDEFRRVRVPGFADYQRRRHALLEHTRRELRLDEFAPKVMSGFVRNRLIDEIYLPLIGDNLAKQIGTVGSGRADQMGMLLLISPPGYGKTTLMEYIANRLGMVFVKINGPALGMGVTSLDPGEAPNATAAQEVDKVNFALEMGNNVLLYVDDIQHTNPEFLQKFISMTDAQRRMEGMWRGRTRTYDMRGKRFAVVMAGNPYTESGERFTVPDMLANRADTYNLGDVLGGRDDIFALSYLENSLTSNPILAPLAGRDQADVHRFIEMAERGTGGEELTHPYAAVEINEIVECFRRMLRIQAVVMAVNQAYIDSASTDDDHRTEPRFQLQGSYRNMNRLAEKVVPVMNDAEIEQLLDDHYLGEAQTLTTGAEANLLKLAQLRGTMTEDQRDRWDEVLGAFQRAQLLGGDDDPMIRVAGAVTGITEQLRELVRRRGGD